MFHLAPCIRFLLCVALQLTELLAVCQPADTTLRTSRDKPGKLLLPISHAGVQCLSFGYVNPSSGVPGAGGKGAAVLRGPMVSKVS
jgi:hypothetical protein